MKTAGYIGLTLLLALTIACGLYGVANAQTILQIGGGGTGWGNPGGFVAGTIPIGNGLSRFATSSGFVFSTSLTRLTFTHGSSTALTVSGTAYFGTASTSNLTISGVSLCTATQALVTNISGVVGCGTINGFSTTSATYWATFGLGFSTTSTDYWKTQRIIGNVSTGSAEAKGGVPFWLTTAGSPAQLGSVSTTTQTFSGPFTLSAVQGFLIGGSNATITWTGLATTSQPTAGQFLVSNGAAGVYGISTSTPTVTAPITYSGTLGSFVGGSGGAFACTSADGSTKGCITAADWTKHDNKVATGSAETKGQMAYWLTTNGSPATLGSVATTTQTFSGPFTLSATQGFMIGGSNATVNWTGLSTTSQPTAGQYLASNGAAGVYGIPTPTSTANTFTGLQTFATGFISQATSSFTTLSGVTASTTNLTISGINGTANNCLQVSAAGVVSGTGSGCGGAATWPFTPSVAGFYNQLANSTSTQLHLGGSPISLSASSTAKFVNADFLGLTSMYATSTYASSTALTSTALFGGTSAITTSETVPLVIGGTAVGSSLELRSTSAAGVGAELTKFTIGNNGATEALRITLAGIGIGTTTPNTALTIASSTAPQICLNGGSNNPLTCFRDFADGTFAIATSTGGFGNATSSQPSIRIDANAVVNMISSFISGLMRIPFAAAFTSTLQGAIGIDTTSGQLRYNYDGSNTKVVLTENDKSFVLSTSTLAYYGAFAASATTSNIRLWEPKRAVTITDLYCVGNGATSTLRVGSGSATTTIICGKDIAANSAGLSTAIAARGNLWVDVGTLIGTAGQSFTLTVTTTVDAD